MNALARIEKVFKSSPEILFDDTSRFILMSDIHRGDGSWADDFSRNQHIWFAAMSHYYSENYTYIEIGDGDELWENKHLPDIIHYHSHVFWLLQKFHAAGRLHFIFGNHDIVKQNPAFVRNNLYEYYDERQKKYLPLFEDITIHEGLVLNHRVTAQKIFLIHGHQVSFLDYDIWVIARFLVRYLWKPLELLGINDPTSTAKNHQHKDRIEKRLLEWAQQQKHMLIAGHTHRPVFAEPGSPPYFNDGSAVHPRCLTGIEIADGQIMLIKWSVKATEDGILHIGRDILAGPEKYASYTCQD